MLHLMLVFYNIIYLFSHSVLLPVFFSVSISEINISGGKIKLTCLKVEHRKNPRLNPLDQQKYHYRGMAWVSFQKSDVLKIATKCYKVKSDQFYVSTSCIL